MTSSLKPYAKPADSALTHVLSRQDVRSPLQAVTGICVGCGLLGLLSANPLLTLAAMAIPPLIVLLLWRTGEPPLLAFAASFQWLQVASPIFAANVDREPLSRQSFGVYFHEATWLSLIAIVVVVLGMALAIRSMPPISRSLTLSLGQRFSLKRLFIAYIVGLIASLLFTWLSHRVGGLRQPVLALASMKWVPLFILCWSTLQCGKNKNLMLLAVGIELVIGFTGYFSTFKNVLFLLMIVVVGTSMDRPKLLKGQLVVLAVVTLLLVTYWQAVKVDYRNYLNGGTGQQVVVVSFDKRVQYLLGSVTRVTPHSMVEGVEEGVRRLGYTTYFGYCIRNVPRSVPHQNGKLWIGAVKHVFMPRVFFPNKEELNESARTNRYTGLRVAGQRQGTAISIGYIGESYVDFGRWLMFLPIFLLGYFYGWIYKYFMLKDPDHLIGMGIATAILLFSAILIETSNIKLVGGVTTSFLAFSVLLWFGREKLIRFLVE
jgi:hypothetical protein